MRWLMLAFLTVVLGVIWACAEAPARDAFDDAEQQEREAIDWLGELRALRANSLAAVESIESLRGQISDDSFRAAMTAAEKELAETTALVEQGQAQRERAAEITVMRQKELDAAVERDKSWLGLGDVGTGAVVAAVPGAGWVLSIWGLIKRGRRQRIAGEKLTAVAVRDHITRLREDPVLDEAFKKLPDNIKASADTALSALPHVFDLIKNRTRAVR